MELIFIILLAITAIVSFFAKRMVISQILSVISALFAFVSVISIALQVSQNGQYQPSDYFHVDSFGSIILLIIGTVGLAAVVYSIAYLNGELKKKIIGPSRVRAYFAQLNIFLAVMFLAVSSSSPIVTWICVEATTLSTALLISYYNKPSAMEAAWKYLIINSIGLLLGFFGTLLFFTISHSVSMSEFITWQSLLDNAIHLDPEMAKIAFVFVLIGYGTKAGLAPMHTWLPDAHGKAPSPVSALLSGVLLNVAMYVILKFKIITDTVADPSFTNGLLITFGIISVVFAAIIILNQQHYKRMMAYSSIENMGLIAIGFGFGGIGIFAAIMHMIYHSLIKSSLFFLSGNLMLKYSTGHINQVRGVLKVMPVTGILIIAAVLAITGMPPFGIFFSEFYIFASGMNSHILIVIFAIAALAILFIGFLRNISSMLFGDKPDHIVAGKNSVWLVIPPAILISIVLILTFYLPPFINTLTANAAGQF
jgi:hydrogenase-4 component F